jgi:hypothetical protein
VPEATVEALERACRDLRAAAEPWSALGAAFKEAEDRLEQVLGERFRIKPDVPEIKRVARR